MDPGETRPWERRPTESAWAYLAFRAFRDLGPTRTVRATAGTPAGQRVPGHIERWATRHDWRARATAWDDARFRLQDAAVLAAISAAPALDVVAPRAELDDDAGPWATIVRQLEALER